MKERRLLERFLDYREWKRFPIKLASVFELIELILCYVFLFLCQARSLIQLLHYTGTAAKETNEKQG